MGENSASDAAKKALGKVFKSHATQNYNKSYLQKILEWFFCLL